MNYYPLFRVRSWKNGMRCMSLSILLKSSSWMCQRHLSPASRNLQEITTRGKASSKVEGRSHHTDARKGKLQPTRKLLPHQPNCSYTQSHRVTSVGWDRGAYYEKQSLLWWTTWLRARSILYDTIDQLYRRLDWRSGRWTLPWCHPDFKKAFDSVPRQRLLSKL